MSFRLDMRKRFALSGGLSDYIQSGCALLIVRLQRATERVVDNIGSSFCKGRFIGGQRNGTDTEGCLNDEVDHRHDDLPRANLLTQRFEDFVLDGLTHVIRRRMSEVVLGKLPDGFEHGGLAHLFPESSVLQDLLDGFCKRVASVVYERHRWSCIVGHSSSEPTSFPFDSYDATFATEHSNPAVSVSIGHPLLRVCQDCRFQ